MSGHVHKLVAKIAKEACAEFYESLMGANNAVYAEWKRRWPGDSEKKLRIRFVNKYWGACIPIARATMARLLDKPIQESLKDEILDALIKDQTLRHGRATGERVIRQGFGGLGT